VRQSQVVRIVRVVGFARLSSRAFSGASCACLRV
jgi:hypothetical protein